MQCFDHDNSNSISQLIRGKSKDLQKLLKSYNGAATPVSNAILSASVLPDYLCLMLERSAVVLLLSIISKTIHLSLS